MVVGDLFVKTVDLEMKRLGGLLNYIIVFGVRWEPPHLLEDRGDVFSGVGVGEQVGSEVLNVLEINEDFRW